MGLEPTVSEASKERLATADLERGGMLAASHVQRYELAARLCSGARVLDLCCGIGYGSRILATTAASVVGVDVAEEAVAAARAGAGADERVSFEQADAAEFLRRQGAGRFDVVVCFEGLEHVPDFGAVCGELKRLAGEGVRLIASLPNSEGFEEQNEFHVTDFGHERMREVAAALDAVVIEQYLGEASIVRRGGVEGGELTGRLVADDQDPAWANHWLLVTGFPEADLDRASAIVELTARANQNQYMRHLETANAELWRANARLGHGRLGTHDAAAAVITRRYEDMVRRAEAAEADARKWHRIAEGNEWARDQVIAEATRGRYRMVDSVFGAIARIPLLGRFARGGYREVIRRF
jgi:2-polyprenyl-3-methyl-5-hydroxy-6-metoxy-1,4-benzoquinol methylase